MQKLVIDTNILSNENGLAELECFLKQSDKNRAILIGEVAAEQSNGGTDNVLKPLAIFTKYHQQFDNVKSSNYLSAAKDGDISSQEGLIAEIAFSNFVGALEALKNKNQNSINQSNVSKKVSTDYMDRVLSQVIPVKNYFSEADRDRFNKNEWDLIKTAQPFTDPLNQKIKCSLEKWNKVAFNTDEPINGFMLRISICVFLTVLRREAYGSLEELSEKNYKRDLIDAMVITYATYFDGVLTNDEKMQKNFKNACGVLTNLYGIAMPPH